MTIGTICCRKVDTAAPHESIRAAAQRMSARGVGTLVVTDAQDRVVGILTDRDVTVRVVATMRDPESTHVAEVMSDSVHTGFQGMPIGAALTLMRTEAVRRLVVVRDDGKVLGIVSLDDVLVHLAHEMGEIGRLIAKEDPRRALVAS
jgi:predicted transcriptional regulator